MIAQESLSFAARIQKVSFFCKTWPAGRLKLGNQHPHTMNSIYNLADLLKSREKFEEAEELFREELAACNSPSMLSLFFALGRSVQKCSEETWFVIPGSWQPPFYFLSFCTIWCGTCQGIASHGKDHEETVCSQRNLCRFLEDLAPCSHGPCFLSDSRRFGSPSVEESNLCRSAEELPSALSSESGASRCVRHSQVTKQLVDGRETGNQHP